MKLNPDFITVARIRYLHLNLDSVVDGVSSLSAVRNRSNYQLIIRRNHEATETLSLVTEAEVWRELGKYLAPSNLTKLSSYLTGLHAAALAERMELSLEAPGHLDVMDESVARSVLTMHNCMRQALSLPAHTPTVSRANPMWGISRYRTKTTVHVAPKVIDHIALTWLPHPFKQGVWHVKIDWPLRELEDYERHKEVVDQAYRLMADKGFTFEEFTQGTGLS